MMHTLQRAITIILKFFTPLTSWVKIVRTFILILVLGFGVTVISNDSENEEATGELPPIVFVSTVSDIDTSEGASFIGTVRAVSEAQIQSEVGGRITAVHAKPGDSVTAGAILATLENSSQYANLLQAEGAYEATLASVAQSAVSADDAKNTLIAAQNNAINTYRTVYGTVNASVLNTVDIFFSNPNEYSVPGVRIFTPSEQNKFLNNSRLALREILPTWQSKANDLNLNSNLDDALVYASEHTKLIIDMVDILITATNKAEVRDTIEGQPASSYTPTLTTLRGTLITTLSTITSAETSLSTARENLRRAEIGSTQNTEISLANAQVKQALGTLRSAQANYEKTVFRSPISGTVNSMRINVGDFISAFTHVAEVANNNAFQISIYAGEADLTKFSVGGTVKINSTMSGTITSIAPAVDPLTQKTEIKIAADTADLTNGSSVSVTINQNDTPRAISTLRVPITAIKFSAHSGTIFTVEDGTLIGVPVEIDTISGSFVILASGIDTDTVFVVDARGLSAGQRVEPIQK